MSRYRLQGLKYLAWIFAGLLFLLLVVLPITMTYLAKSSQSAPPIVAEYLALAEGVMYYVMVAFSAAWMFFLGGTFASFLNVVAARVPQGRSILGSSHCPYCNVKLTFRDNVPYWGWIKNWGRCSNCRLPITSRYLFVEVVLGAIFLGLAAMTLLTGGTTLPIREPSRIVTLSRMILEPKPDLAMILVLQLVSLLGVFVFALIELDRQRIPVSVWLVSMLISVAVILIWPEALLISWIYPIVNVDLPMPMELAAATAGIGAAFGFFCGWILDALLTEKHETGEEGGKQVRSLRIAYGLSLVGLFASWQSVLVVGMVYVVVRALMVQFVKTDSKNYVSNMFWSPNTALLVAVLIHLASWSWMGALGG